MTEEAINGIINMTRNDPTLDALFNIFKVGKFTTGNPGVVHSKEVF